jgi:hypothetical protein
MNIGLIAHRDTTIGLRARVVDPAFFLIADPDAVPVPNPGF